MRASPKNKPVLLLFGFLLLGVISYNFYVANEHKYDTGGDAAAFVSLGTSLAKVQKYGHLEIPGDIIEGFKENKISDQDYNFKGHSTWRPPIWPLIIASVFLLFGYNLTYLLIFKFLLHFLGIYIFYKSLKLLGLKEILLLTGAFLYGIHPAWQLYSRVFLSEPITLFFITLWVYFLLRFIKGKSGWWSQASLAGILILCHPYYIFLPFSTWLILALNKQLQLKTFILSSALCAAVISTWIIRNFIVLDTNEVVLTTSSGAVMAKGWNKEVPQKHTNTKGDLADETLVLQDFQDIERSGPYEVRAMQRYKDATLVFIRSNPEMILPIIGRKLLSAFNPFPETPRPGLLETGRWVFQFLALLALLYILIFSKNPLIKSLAWGLVLSTIGITILTYSGFRFRMPQVGLELLFLMYVLKNFYKTQNIQFSKN